MAQQAASYSSPGTETKVMATLANESTTRVIQLEYSEDIRSAWKQQNGWSIICSKNEFFFWGVKQRLIIYQQILSVDLYYRKPEVFL